MARLMLQPLYGGNASKDFSLGFSVNQQGSFLRFGHGGYTDGYRSEMICFDNGQGLITLTNGNSQALLREITKAMAVEYSWPEKEYYPKKRKLAKVSSDTLRQYVEEYEFPQGPVHGSAKFI